MDKFVQCNDKYMHRQIGPNLIMKNRNINKEKKISVEGEKVKDYARGLLNMRLHQ